MSLDAVLTQLLMGLTVGVNLVLVATGLTLVFGMMGVINFAHSALFMLGAYAGLVVNVRRLTTIVFALGSALAAAAGVILGTMTSLSPQMGGGIVLDAFIAIVIGGLGSFTGAIVGSLLLGQVQSFGVALFPAF